MLEHFQVSPPGTVYDWLAVKESYRDRLASLDMEYLYVLYGLSCLEPHRDEAFRLSVEDLLSRADDPILQRFLFACHLGNYFDGDRASWVCVNVAVEPNSSYQWRYLQPTEPGYVGEIPPFLNEVTVRWLMDGICTFRNDDELMAKVRNIKNRFLGGYTFLTRADIDQLETAMAGPVELFNEATTKVRFQRAVDFLHELAKEKKQLDDENPGLK